MIFFAAIDLPSLTFPASNLRFGKGGTPKIAGWKRLYLVFCNLTDSLLARYQPNNVVTFPFAQIYARDSVTVNSWFLVSRCFESIRLD